MTEAVFGIIGVIVGSFIPWMREAFAERRFQSRHARYLAVRVICSLDEYVEKCIEVVNDDGGEAHPEHVRSPQIKDPEPPTFPEDVDWKSIDPDLMFDLLSFPNMARAADRTISFVIEYEGFGPDYDEVFEERHYQYADLGLRALELSNRLRKKYLIPPHTESNRFNRREFLARKRDEIEQERARNKSRSPFLNETDEDEKEDRA